MMKVIPQRTKQDIIDHHGYTDLVYDRIRKKLSISCTNSEIEQLILDYLTDTPEADYRVKGKNIYIYHHDKNIRVTVNANTCRIITVDSLA